VLQRVAEPEHRTPLPELSSCGGSTEGEENDGEIATDNREQSQRPLFAWPPSKSSGQSVEPPTEPPCANAARMPHGQAGRRSSPPLFQRAFPGPMCHAINANSELRLSETNSFVRRSVLTQQEVVSDPCCRLLADAHGHGEQIMFYEYFARALARPDFLT